MNDQQSKAFDDWLKNQSKNTLTTKPLKQLLFSAFLFGLRQPK